MWWWTKDLQRTLIVVVVIVVVVVVVVVVISVESVHMKIGRRILDWNVLERPDSSNCLVLIACSAGAGHALVKELSSGTV
jgi:hypothetical protein